MSTLDLLKSWILLVHVAQKIERKKSRQTNDEIALTNSDYSQPKKWIPMNGERNETKRNEGQHVAIEQHNDNKDTIHKIPELPNRTPS